MKTLFITTLNLKDNVDFFDSAIEQAGVQDITCNACKHIDDDTGFNQADYHDCQIVFFDGNFLTKSIMDDDLLLILVPVDLDIDPKYCEKYKINKEDILSLANGITMNSKAGELIAFFRYSEISNIVNLLKRYKADKNLNFIQDITNISLQAVKDANLMNQFNDLNCQSLFNKTLNDRFGDNKIQFNSPT